MTKGEAPSVRVDFGPSGYRVFAGPKKPIHLKYHTEGQYTSILIFEEENHDRATLMPRQVLEVTT